MFAPPTETWVRLAPQYATLRVVTALIGWVTVTVIAVVALVRFAPQWLAIAGGVAIIIFATWRVLRQRRLAAAWGYAERADDLYITHGLWFKTLTVVPYGRMQVIEVTSGPLERRFGLATVRLVTASASTDAHIPGLTAERAADLRDRISERGDVAGMGL